MVLQNLTFCLINLFLDVSTDGLKFIECDKIIKGSKYNKIRKFFKFNNTS